MALDTFAKLTLAPWLIAQGRRVRRSALILPEPPGPRAGTTGEGRPLSLLIAGDSSAAGVGASHQSAALSGRLAATLGQTCHLTWQLEAGTGATSATTLAHLKSLPPARFDTVILVLGVNDVTTNTGLRRWLTLQHRLHETLRSRFGAAHILRSALPPMGHFPLLPHPLRWTLGQTARRFDRALAQVCAARDDLTHVPLDLPFAPDYMARDGFHPSEKAYALWAEMLAQEIPLPFI